MKLVPVIASALLATCVTATVHTQAIAAAQNSVAPGPIKVSERVMKANLIRESRPHYPELAKQNRVEGNVVLRAVIGKDGLVKSLEVISGPRELRDATLGAARNRVYKPYLLNGEAVEVETTITTNYSFG